MARAGSYSVDGLRVHPTTLNKGQRVAACDVRARDGVGRLPGVAVQPARNLGSHEVFAPPAGLRAEATSRRRHGIRCSPGGQAVYPRGVPAAVWSASAGGRVALAVAPASPDSVEKLVMVNATRGRQAETSALSTRCALPSRGGGRLLAVMREALHRCRRTRESATREVSCTPPSLGKRRRGARILEEAFMEGMREMTATDG